MRRIVFLVALALAATTAAAQIYKWVDEKGVTHYSESPPPDKKATKVETGPASAPAPASPGWKQKAIDSRNSDIERRQADEAARRKSEYDDAVRKDRCLRAQRDLQVFEAQRPVYRVNERGEKVYMDDSARPAALQEARRNVEAFCK